MDKNEELQKWLNDDRYVRRIDLQKLWEMSKKRTNDLLQKENVKAIKSLYLPDTGQACFYSKEECERAYENSRAKKQKQDFDRNVELQKWLNNTEYIQTKELNILWRLSALSTYKHLHLNNIRPVKRISRYPEKGCCVFYDRAECERARPFINQPEQKEVEKVEEKRETKNKQLDGIFCGDIALGKFVIVSSASDARIVTRLAGDIVCPVLSTKTPDANYDYIKKIIGKDICLVMIEDNDPEHKSVMYWLNLPGASPWIIPAKYGKNITDALDNGVVIRDLIKAGLEDLCKGFYAGSSRQIAVMPEPKEQTPDIIPADTIDLFTMSELETELKQRGVELTAEVRNKINASNMSEMKHIATMLRGNAKSITIRLSVLNEIAGQLKNTDDVLNAEAEIGLKDESQFNMPLSDIAESANMTKDKARYWLKLADCSPIIKDRVDLWPIQSVNLLKDMNAYVENGMTPNAAAAMLKKDGQNNKTTPTDDQSDSEFTSIRIGKAERQKLRIMAVENRSGITEQLHLIINSIWGLTYRK